METTLNSAHAVVLHKRELCECSIRTVGAVIHPAASQCGYQFLTIRN
jgi:hypothetical protein